MSDLWIGILSLVGIIMALCVAVGGFLYNIKYKKIILKKESAKEGS